MATKEKPRYVCQADPAKGVPLAWIFKQDEKVVGDPPLHQYGQYRQLEIAGTGSRWLVHCSFAGALEFVFLALGEDNVEIDEEEGLAMLFVPNDMIGAWIGSGGVVASFLKHMFGVNRVEVVGRQ